jgi:hypothetical protein
METRFPGVFAIGDNTSIPLEMGLPLPKTGVVAYHQAQAVAGPDLAEAIFMDARYPRSNFTSPAESGTW